MAEEEPSPAPAENGHIEQPAAEGANRAGKSKADKKKEKRQKQKQNRQQRRCLDTAVNVGLCLIPCIRACNDSRHTLCMQAAATAAAGAGEGGCNRIYHCKGVGSADAVAAVVQHGCLPLNSSLPSYPKYIPG